MEGTDRNPITQEDENLVSKISDAIRQGDYVTGATLTQNMREDFNKDGLYAGIAMGLAYRLDEMQEGKPSPKAQEVAGQLLEYFQSQSSYFTKG